MSRKRKYAAEASPKDHTAFFAYPSGNSAQEEIIDRTVRNVNHDTKLSLQTWRRLRGNSSRIITEILEEIARRDILIGDITGLNPNVLFELGFAFALRKSILLCIQGHSSTDKDRDLKELEMLSSLRITSFQNSEDLANSIRSRYLSGLHQEPDISRYGVNLDAQPSPHTGLFLKGITRHDIGQSALKAFKGQFSQTLVDDWSEDGSQPLTWYIRSLVQSSGVAALFVDPKWDRSREINGRFSFVCGMACALQKQVLMLGLPGFSRPFDYKEIMKMPTSPESAQHLIRDAFEHKTIGTPTIHALRPERKTPTAQAMAPTEDLSNSPLQGPYLTKGDRELVLLSINLGDTIAENEEQELQEYFVETGQFARAANAKQAVVVGSKGTGKTAMFFRLRDRLAANKRNLVCDIKPADYMIEAFLSAMRKASGSVGVVSHITDSAWKLILYAQLLRTLHEEFSLLPVQSNAREEGQELDRFVEENSDLILAPFERQLEVAASWLSEAQYDTTNFSSVIHSRFINHARRVLIPLLSGRDRIVILLDNLDKAWRVDADLKLQSQMVFSLLGINRRLKSDFGEDSDIRFIIFLRRNIYEYVFQKGAREPDKLISDTIELVWDDKETLLRLIEERFKTTSQRTLNWEGNPWETFFAQSVGGVPVKDWIFSNVLPRPRDLIHFLRKSVEVAINRDHERILPEDLEEALKSHSAFAMSQILAEYKAEEPWIGPVLSSMMGGSTIVSFEYLMDWLSRIPIVSKHCDSPRDVIAKLVEIRFMGVLTEDSIVRHASTVEEGVLLAEKVKNHPTAEPLHFAIHPAFHIHLGLNAPRGSELVSVPTHGDGHTVAQESTLDTRSDLPARKEEGSPETVASAIRDRDVALTTHSPESSTRVESRMSRWIRRVFETLSIGRRE